MKPTKSAAEKDLAKAQKELMKLREKMAKLRRKIPKVEIKDYAFKDSVGGVVLLSALFGTRDELILIHNMGVSCTYCTMWADGFNGVHAHLRDRAAFAVESPDPPETQRTFASGRGWGFRFVSSEGTVFRRDMGFESKDGDPIPGVTTFQKDSKGRMFKIASAEFGPGDDYCIVWNFFDLLAKGAGAWEPKFRY